MWAMLHPPGWVLPAKRSSLELVPNQRRGDPHLARAPGLLIWIKLRLPLSGSVHPMKRDRLLAISIGWRALLVIAFLFLLAMMF